MSSRHAAAAKKYPRALAVRPEKIIPLSKQIRLQDEQLIMEQAGLEKDIETLFKQVRLLENKHLQLVFIRAARQIIAPLIRNKPLDLNALS
jgi:hypothetical protein